MLQYLWSCYGSVFRDMADEEHGNAKGFRNAVHLGCALPNLRQAAGGRIDVRRFEGLYRVDDHHVGFHRLEVF